MTFADLRALHAVIGAAIDDIERVYRPPPSLRRPSNPSNPQALTLSTSSTSSFHSARSSSIPRSSQSTDSDVEGEDDEDDDDDDMPLTPVSASNAHLHSSIATISGPPNSVRFASTSKRTFGKGRERAHTMSSLPQPSFGSPGIMPPMPPPILKQPPLDFPSLDSPVFIPATPPSSRPSTDATSSTPFQAGNAPTPPTSPSNTTSMSAKVSSEFENAGSTTATLGDPTLRQKEWKKKCEELATSSEVIKAVNKIVAACGQLTASVQKPFLSVCDAAMGYHLPSCLRFLEAAHIVEMLREAGSDGLHVSDIAKRIDVGLRLSRGEAETSDGLFAEQDTKGKSGVDANHLSHILRLLATHHITREVRPDVFANNRISSVIDSGKSWKELVEMSTSAERKYEGTDGIAAFVGMCTDELFKASAYLTDCYLSPPLPASPKQQSTSRSHKHEHSQSSIPPVPPLPTTVFTHRSRGSISDTTSNAHRLGIYSPNDSRTSLASLPEDEREGKEEAVPNAMTFASNPLSASTKAGPGSTTPPTPTTTQRPGILKRLSSRTNLQVSSTPPPPMPETPKSPVLREAPETPRTRVPSMTSLLRQVQETPKSPAVLSTLRELVSTPRSTPNPQREETGDTFEDETMRTPRSTPRRDSVASSIHSETDVKHATPRWTPSRESLRTLAKKGSFASLRARRQGGGSGQLQISEPLAILPQPYEGTLVSDSSQGPLGPAFDLRPPAIALSPRSTPSPKLPPSPTSAHIYGVDGFSPRSSAPPLPPKSALRGTPSESGLPSPVEPTFPRISPPPVGTASKVKKAKGAQKTNEMHAPFNVAFNTNLRFFDWLEKKENEFRLKRFGKAMTGTEKWEVPGSIIGGFPWHELPNRSVVVDVGGGIGSTSMLLANAFPQLRFVIQDRAPVAEMGGTAWRARCPELLDSGRAAFQAHDFFNVQPDLPPELDTGLALESESEVEPEENGEQKLGTKVSGDAHASDASIIPAVFLMRVITHDWPDSYVTRILLRLRHAAGPNTKLVLADFVLPLACVDEDDDVDAADSELSRKKITRDPLPGTLRSLAPEGSPLLPNLGKANANAYWMDLTMRVMFNAQERTLRELAALTLSAGWKVVQVTRAEGSLFGHIVAVAVDIPPESLTLSELEEANSAPASPAQDAALDTGTMRSHMADTFLTYSDLPSEAAIREGVATGSIKLNAFKGAGKKRGRRERAYTFGGQRDTKDGKDNKGGEVRRGFRTLMKMLSKSQMKDTGSASADAAGGGQSKQRSKV